MNLTGNKAKALISGLIAVSAALALIVAGRAVLAPSSAGGTDEGTLKKQLDEAIRRGGLELHEAKFWRPAPPPPADSEAIVP